MAKKKSQIHRSRQEWESIIEKQQASGKTAAQYCREHDLSEKSFYGWRRRLGRRVGIKSEGFIRIHSGQEKPGSIIQIHTPGGYCLDVSGDLDAGRLRTVLKALESI